MTFEEAKKLYFKYDCSLFAMAREEQNAYENYKLLNIPSLTEEEWRQELFIILWEQLKKNGSSDLFNRMYNLSENRHSKGRLFILKEALNNVNYENLKINVCVSETVLGRKDLSERSGMIFWAYDLGEQELAKELLQFVMKLLTSQIPDKEISSRFGRNIKKCHMINSELRLGVRNTI